MNAITQAGFIFTDRGIIALRVDSTAVGSAGSVAGFEFATFMQLRMNALTDAGTVLIGLKWKSFIEASLSYFQEQNQIVGAIKFWGCDIIFAGIVESSLSPVLRVYSVLCKRGWDQSLGILQAPWCRVVQGCAGLAWASSMKNRLFTFGLSSLLLTAPTLAQDAIKLPSATYTGIAAPLPKDDPKLSETQARAKYNTCTSGYYGGPQKGKVWYSQDPYLWVVTPAFAKRMCMPPEFVHEGLKGAEAVAFRIAEKNEERNCGWGGNSQNCSGELVFQVEIYIDSNIKIPKRHYGRYYQVPQMPSSLLVSATETELKKLRELNKNHPPDALTAIFDTTQVHLAGFQDKKLAWPLKALYAQTYYGQLFEGIDYYKFEGTAIRSFNNPRMKDLGIDDFRIDFKHLNDKDRHTIEGMTEKDFAHVIHLPPEFSKKMAAIDISLGKNIPELIQQVLKK